MTICVVTDSTSDLPSEIIRGLGIAVIPILIDVGKTEYRDGIDLTREQFYERLPHFKPSPVTAAPGPNVFHRVYDQLAAQGASQILSIHISHELSAIVNIARQAAAETHAVPVTVFDSRQLSLGTGFQVQSAAQAAARGLSMSEILAVLEAQIRRTYVIAALDTLEYVRRSGRMNGAIAALGSLLQFKPVMRMYDGNPTAERVRTRARAMLRIKELIVAHAPFERLALLHSNAADRARALLDEVRSFFPEGDVWLQEINPVLGAHVGPGVVGFAGISKQG